jgi:hypothetical protein
MNQLIADAALHAKFTNLRWELQKIKAQLLGSPVIGRMLVNYYGKPTNSGERKISAALQAVGLQNRVGVSRIMSTNYYTLLHGRRELRPYEVAVGKKPKKANRQKKAKKAKSNQGNHYGQIKNANKNKNK